MLFGKWCLQSKAVEGPQAFHFGKSAGDACSNEAPLTQGQIAGMLSDATDAAADLHVQTDAMLAWLEELQALMSQRFSADLIVDLTTLRNMLSGVKAVLPAVAEEIADAGPGDTEEREMPLRQGRGVQSVDTRQDAIRAIELVCAYLERHEPTNPAQLLLRRAARVIDKNFLQLVRELAPDAVKEVARVMGVDPSTITDQN